MAQKKTQHLIVQGSERYNHSFGDIRILKMWKELGKVGVLTYSISCTQQMSFQGSYLRSWRLQKRKTNNLNSEIRT
jgi:hypothetical protein